MSLNKIMNVDSSIPAKAKLFVCEICNKGFSRKTSLSKHLQYHTSEKPFICEVCNKRFLRKHTLNRHLQSHAAKKPYICKICTKGFSDRTTLKRHIYVHTKEKLFVCEVCNKGFSQSSALIAHHHTHLEKNPFICEICDKGFCQRNSLIIHHRFHTNERPFVCDICSKSFFDKSHLRKHLLIHNNEKPFICEICNKQFCQRSDLKRHFYNHCKEKPYVCKICSKAFSALYRLNNHLRIHSGVNTCEMPSTSSGVSKRSVEITEASLEAIKASLRETKTNPVPIVIPELIIGKQKDASSSQTLQPKPSTLPEDEGSDVEEEDAEANDVAETAYLITHSYDKLKQKLSKHKSQLHLYKNIPSSVVDEVEKGHILTESQNFARTLMEMPANHITPSIFASTIEEKFRNSQVQVLVRDKDWIESMKMGAFLSVSRGSDEPPTFIELHYNGLPDSDECYALVGKGVTGGLSLEPSTSGDKMQADVGEAACVVSIILAASSLKMKINIKGFVPLTENLPSGKASKLGDVVFSMNGKSLQIDNTDAEEKLILADALCYAQKFNPKAILDAATLTDNDSQRTTWNMKRKRKCSSSEQVRRLLARQNFLTEDEIGKKIIETQSSMHNEMQQIRSDLEKIANNQEQLISLQKSTNEKLDLLIQITALGHNIKIMQNSE